MKRIRPFLSPACTFACCREFTFAIITIIIQFLCACWVCACALVWFASRLFPFSLFNTLLIYCGSMIPLFVGGWLAMGFLALESERKLQRAKRIGATPTLSRNTEFDRPPRRTPVNAPRVAPLASPTGNLPRGGTLTG